MYTNWGDGNTIMIQYSYETLQFCSAGIMKPLNCQEICGREKLRIHNKICHWLFVYNTSLLSCWYSPNSTGGLRWEEGALGGLRGSCGLRGGVFILFSSVVFEPGIIAAWYKKEVSISLLTQDESGGEKSAGQRGGAQNQCISKASSHAVALVPGGGNQH